MVYIGFISRTHIANYILDKLDYIRVRLYLEVLNIC